MFCGMKSPLSRVYGWGFVPPASDADLDTVETFYRSRGLPVRVQVCPLMDPSLLRVRGERGYAVADFMNVYARRIEPPGDTQSKIPGLCIRVATEEEAQIGLCAQLQAATGLSQMAWRS